MTARIARLFAAITIAVGLIVMPATASSPLAATSVQAASLPRWTGTVDVYRAGSFSTQKTYLWCTAADVQIARNIVRSESDHSRSTQSRYFDWMRARNRYAIPVSDGVDPQGWAAGMRNFVDGRYRLATFRSYTSALRSAVTSLRLTNLPVGVLVARGGHAWLMTGFSATADPAATRDFTVTSVRVVGSLYGLQSRNGYDMPPNTRLSATAFKRFFTPWHYAGISMVWEGLYGTVQAAPANAAPIPQGARSLQPPIPGLTRPMPSPATRSADRAPAPAAAWSTDDTAAAPPFEPLGTGTASPVAPLFVFAVAGAALVAIGAIVVATRSRARWSNGRSRRGPHRARRESDFA